MSHFFGQLKYKACVVEKIKFFMFRMIFPCMITSLLFGNQIAKLLILFRDKLRRKIKWYHMKLNFYRKNMFIQDINKYFDEAHHS